MKAVPGDEVALRRKRRRRRRIIFGAALAAALLGASPFLFTGPILRYWLAHSAYRALGIRFRSASLSLMGRLVLNDVAIDDTGEFAGQPLLSAASLRVDYAWSRVFAGRVEQVSVRDLHLTLRPGRDTPLTLLRLAAPAPGSATSATTAPAGNPFWFDQLQIDGSLTLTGYGPWQQIAQIGPHDLVPLRAVVAMTGSPITPTRDVSLLIGDPDLKSNAPVISSRLHIMPGPGGATTIGVETLAVSNLQPMVLRGQLEPWAGNALPAELRQDITGRLAQALFTGSLTVGGAGAAGGAVSVNGTARLIGLALHAAPENGAPPNGTPATLDQFNATTHVAGRFSNNPLKDLTFTQTHCSWDTLQVGEWRLARGTADWSVDGTEIVLQALHADLPDAQLRMTGGYDTARGELAHLRLWLEQADAARWLARLPDSVRAALPCAFDGTVTARLFLTDTDADHYITQAELTCPDRLALRPSEGPAATARGSAGSGVTLATVSNINASATLTWSRRLDSAPELTRGRLTADELQVLPPAPSAGPGARGAAEPAVATKIISDFTVARGLARLDDFYADLADGAAVSADAQYTFKTQTLDHAGITLRDIDAAQANPWLPDDVHLTGRFDAQLQVGLSPETASLTAALQTTTAAGITLPGGSIAVPQTGGVAAAGGGGPTATLRATLDRRTSIADIETAELDGLNGLRLDAGLVMALRRTLPRVAPDSTPAEVLDLLKDGATASIDRIAALGRLDLHPRRAPHFSGTLTLAGLDAGTLPEAPTRLALDNLALRAGLDVPLAAGDLLATGKITGGQFLAEKLTLGDNSIANLAGRITAGHSRLAVTGGAFAFAGGSFTADAAVNYEVGARGAVAARLDHLHAKFSGVDQKVITHNLAPERFTAEGPVSGTLDLTQDQAGAFDGTITIDADAPGRLSIAREVSSSTFAAPIAEALKATPGAIVPPNLNDIIVGQFSNYPYTRGHAVLKDGPDGALLSLDYTRAPLVEGDPGFGVMAPFHGQQVQINFQCELRGETLHFPGISVLRVLSRSFGLEDLILKRPLAPASAPTTVHQP